MMCFLQGLLLLCPSGDRKNRMCTRRYDAIDTEKISDDAMQKEWGAEQGVDTLEQEDVFQLERHPSEGLDVYCSDYDDDMMP